MVQRSAVSLRTSVGLTSDRRVVKNERQRKVKRTKVSTTGPVAWKQYTEVKYMLAADEITWHSWCCSLQLRWPDEILGQELTEDPWWSEEKRTHSSPVEWHTLKLILFYRDVDVLIFSPEIWSLADTSNIEWWRVRSSNTIAMFSNKKRQIFARSASVYFNYTKPCSIGWCWLCVQGHAVRECRTVMNDQPGLA